jgi:DNA-binding transcriptional MerR regulator
MKNKKKQTVSIGEAARLAGVTVKQIRHWMEKGYIPERPRVICGMRAYRQFGEADLKAIKAVKSYLDQGYTLLVAAEKAKAEISIEKGGLKNA